MAFVFRCSILFFVVLFLLACGGGNSETPSSSPPLPSNVAPTVDAGSNIRAKELDIVNLAAIGSDSDGTIANINWTQIDGPGIAIIGPDSFTPNFISPDVESQIDITLEITITDDDGAASTDTIIITVVPSINVSISIEENANVFEVISGSSGSLIVESNDTVLLEDSGYDTLIGTIDSSDNLALMSLTDGSAIELSGLSTVEVLLGFVPSISQVFSENTNYFDNQLASLPEIIELANYISANSDWSAEQVEFESLFIAALEATLLNLDDLSQPAVKSAKGVATPQVFHLGDELSEKGYSQQQFRTKVTMLPSTSQDGSYKVQVKNLGFYRWIIGFIDDEPNAGSFGDDGIWSFILPSESALFARLIQDYPTNTSDLISPSVYPTNIDKQGAFGVYSYGLSLADIANAPTSGKAAGAFWLATSYTILFDAALPLIGKISPALDRDKCVEAFFNVDKMFSSTSDGLAAKVASSSTFRQYIKAGQYDQAAIEATDIALELIFITGIECIGTQYTGKLEKKVAEKIKDIGRLLSKFNLLATVVELGIKAPNAVLEQKLGKSQRFFKISNTNEQDVDFIARDYVLAPTVGSRHYSTSEHLANFDPTITDNYLGTCDDKTPLCNAFTFDDEPPYIIDFTVGCKHPVTSADIPCATAEISAFFKNNPNLEDKAESSTVDSDGKIRLEYQANNIGEYVGEVVTTDTVGGVSKANLFNLQIKRAQPQVSIYRDGKELAYVIENGVMTIQNPVDVTPLANATSSSIELEIVNTGFGTANIDNVTEPLADGFIITTETGMLNGLGKNNQAAGKQTITINYTPPAGTTDVNDKLTITGNLADKSVHSFVTQNEYSAIVIPVSSSPCDIEENLTNITSLTVERTVSSITLGEPLIFESLLSTKKLNCSTPSPFGYGQYFSGKEIGAVESYGYGNNLDFDGFSVSQPGFHSSPIPSEPRNISMRLPGHFRTSKRLDYVIEGFSNLTLSYSAFEDGKLYFTGNSYLEINYDWSLYKQEGTDEFIFEDSGTLTCSISYNITASRTCQ